MKMKACPFWVFVSSAVYLSLYAFFGINFSDEGYHYYEHLQAFYGFGMPWKMTFLTNYIGGLWMYVFIPVRIQYFLGPSGRNTPYQRDLRSRCLDHKTPVFM